MRCMRLYRCGIPGMSDYFWCSYLELIMNIKHKLMKLVAKESLARMRKRVIEASIRQRMELVYNNIFFQGNEGYKHDARYENKWW